MHDKIQLFIYLFIYGLLNYTDQMTGRLEDNWSKVIGKKS